MYFRKVILLLIGDTTLNLLLSETIQLSTDMNKLYDKKDTDDDKKCKLIYEILKGIRSGDIRSVHMTQDKATIYLKILDDVLEGKAQIRNSSNSPF